MNSSKQAIIFFIILLILMIFPVQAGAYQTAVPILPIPETGLQDTVLILPEDEDPAAAEALSDDTLCMADETIPDNQNCGSDEMLSLSGDLPASPVIGTDTEEAIMTYSLPDPKGEEFLLGDLIRRNRITMLNVWGISCAPCLVEMPNLSHLRDKYQDQGFEVIGLASDLLDPWGEADPELLEEAREMITELEVTYPILVMSGEIRNRMKIIATPTTFFVNSKGQMIGDVIMGTRSEKEWDLMIRDMLEQAGS